MAHMTQPVPQTRKDRLERKIRMTRDISDFIDRTADRRGISYSDVVNLILSAVVHGEPLPFCTDYDRA